MYWAQRLLHGPLLGLSSGSRSSGILSFLIVALTYLLLDFFPRSILFRGHGCLKMLRRDVGPAREASVGGNFLDGGVPSLSLRSLYIIVSAFVAPALMRCSQPPLLSLPAIRYIRICRQRHRLPRRGCVIGHLLSTGGLGGNIPLIPPRVYL